MAVFAKRALLGHQWHRDVRLRLAGALIGSVESGSGGQDGDTRVDTLLPEFYDPAYFEAKRRGEVTRSYRRLPTAPRMSCTSPGTTLATRPWIPTGDRWSAPTWPGWPNLANWPLPAH